MKMNTFKITLLFVIFIFILPLFLNNGLNASNNPQINNNQQFRITELNRLILDQLTKCKIVMLDDAYHGHGFFMFKVSKFLNYWIDQLENQHNARLPNKLVLFLEENEKAVGGINRFLDTGDVSNFLKFYIEYDSEVMSNIFSIDFCIFLHELLHINQRLNQGANPTAELKIVGVERPPFDMNQAVNMSREEFLCRKARYFAYERDRLISQNIQSFLNANPGFKGIVFYGGAHLIREKMNKKHYLNMPAIKDDMYSYFLAHYLDSLYTRNKVCVFYERPIFNFEYQNILKLPAVAEKPDYFVSSKPYPNSPLTMSFARSKTYLKALYEVLLKYQDKESEAEKRMYQNLALKFTQAIMHIYLYETIENRKELRKTAEEVLNKASELLETYNVVESLQMCDEGLTNNIMNDDRYETEVVNMLSNIPSFQILPGSENAFEKGHISPAVQEKIESLHDDISTYLAIHTLFIAEPDEEQEILDYLKDKLHLEYSTKENWFRWWQSKYLSNL
jgi:hypothetical protein